MSTGIVSGPQTAPLTGAAIPSLTATHSLLLVISSGLLAEIPGFNDFSHAVKGLHHHLAETLVFHITESAPPPSPILPESSSVVDQRMVSSLRGRPLFYDN